MPNKSFVEDMLTMASGALGNLAEARHEIKAKAKQRAATVARDFDLVGRDEFDAAMAMLAKARDAQEDLAARLARIESKLGLSTPSKTAAKPVKTKNGNLPSVKTKREAGGKSARAKRG